MKPSYSFDEIVLLISESSSQLDLIRIYTIVMDEKSRYDKEELYNIYNIIEYVSFMNWIK